ARHPDAARLAPLLRAQPEHAGDPQQLWRRNEGPGNAVLGSRTYVGDDGGSGARACRPRPGAQSGDAGGKAHAAAHLLRSRHGVDDPRDALAGQTRRARAVQRPMILRLLSEWFSQWAAEVGSLSWL